MSPYSSDRKQGLESCTYASAGSLGPFSTCTDHCMKKKKKDTAAY